MVQQGEIFLLSKLKSSSRLRICLDLKLELGGEQQAMHDDVNAFLPSTAATGYIHAQGFVAGRKSFSSSSSTITVPPGPLSSKSVSMDQ
jgi:hypothetical protein